VLFRGEGAIICYICRQDITTSGYAHFCQTAHCDHKKCAKCKVYALLVSFVAGRSWNCRADSISLLGRSSNFGVSPVTHCCVTPVQLFTDTIEDDRAAMKEAGMQALLKQQQGQEASSAAPPSSSSSSSGNKGGTGKAAGTGAGGAAPAAVGANKVTGKAKFCVVC
jgi:hypothetical protein